MKSKLKILMLEDLKEDAELTSRVLAKSGLDFESKQVDTQPEFEEAIHNYKPDVVLSDHTLPQFNSIEALKLCKKAGLIVPFILVTGAVSEEFAVSCLKQGADDYILKTNLIRLPSSIKNHLRRCKQIQRRKLAEENLQLQNEELLKKNKDLDSFVYTISHNLHAPLQSILGLLSLAQTQDQNDVMHYAKYFEMMNHSVLKLDETLKEIISLYKNMRTEIECQKIDLHKIIDECIKKLKMLKGANNLLPQIHIEELYPFYSDPVRIFTMLKSLIANAIMYQDTAKKEHSLSITIKVNKESARITIEDNGIGIEDDIKPKIFDMFYRGSEKSEGAGLGLYIVKEIVEKLSGKISIESIPNVGTSVNIEIPNSPALTGVLDPTYAL